MKLYALIGNFTTAPNDRDALIEILEEAATIMEDVSGCKQYILYEDAVDDEKIWVTEIWESKEAHDESLTRTDVRAIIARAIPLLKGTPEQGIQLNPVSGKGL